MKRFFQIVLILSLYLPAYHSYAQTSNKDLKSKSLIIPENGSATKHLFIDVHEIGPGKLTVEGVAAAHAKDLATEKKYGVDFIKYWVDTAQGEVYCLSMASDSNSIVKTHAEAHGLLPTHIYQVNDGVEAKTRGGNYLFLDVHELGPGHVKAADVAAAHQKDLAVEKKYGVNFINYWVDERKGVVMCLSEAPDSTSIINTHKEAHGLIPKYVLSVKQGQ
jgi:Protein of unknown function (DUF4242)